MKAIRGLRERRDKKKYEELQERKRSEREEERPWEQGWHAAIAILKKIGNSSHCSLNDRMTSSSSSVSMISL